MARNEDIHIGVRRILAVIVMELVLTLCGVRAGVVECNIAFSSLCQVERRTTSRRVWSRIKNPLRSLGGAPSSSLKDRGYSSMVYGAIAFFVRRPAWPRSSCSPGSSMLVCPAVPAPLE